MANKYEIYYGQFPCHTCGEVVASMRFYKEIKLTTWMCSKKHMSEVSLEITKKTKKDYERKD
jgi:deoxycytidylate deaminase